ncbi:hypothetical protein TNCV_3628241 [Trichonephila clavipes]|nr:hypothetical protein TNCV_3628241 [Trichonephila clavipes]
MSMLSEGTVAAVAEWYRYRIVARLVTSSSPVPPKTRRVGQRCTLNLSRAETSSRCYTRAFGDGPRNFEPWSSDDQSPIREVFSGTGLITSQPRVHYLHHWAIAATSPYSSLCFNDIPQKYSISTA